MGRSRFARNLRIVFATLAVVVIGTFFAYRHFIGFAGESLARFLPADTLAYIELKHVRRSALSLYFDDQFRAAQDVAMAVALTLSDSSREKTTLPEHSAEIDSAQLRALAKHFKSSLAFAALPPEDRSTQLVPDVYLLARFHGNPDTLYQALVKLTAPFERAGEVPQWQTEYWEGHVLRSLAFSQLEALPFDLAWTVSEDTFFAATSAERLKRILILNTDRNPEKCLASRNEWIETDSKNLGRDLSVFIDLQQSLPLATAWGDAYLRASPDPIARSVSFSRFVEGLGLMELQSLAYSFDFTGERPSRLDLRYRNRTGLLGAIALEPASHQLLDTNPLAYVSTGTLDLGEALLVVKNATFKASPISVFPYLGIASQFTRETKLILDELLRDGFEPSLTFSRNLEAVDSIDGTRLAIDQTLILRTNDADQLRTVSKTYRLRLAKALGRRSRIAIRNEIEIVEFEPAEPNSTQRLAFCLRDDALLIGVGSLRNFYNQLERPKIEQEVTFDFRSNGTPIGYSLLDLSAFPEQAQSLANAFYHQLNPDKPIPVAFRDFDWTSLAPLNPRRASATFDDGAGRITVLAKQLSASR